MFPNNTHSSRPVCKYWAAGEHCPFGPTCKFPHFVDEPGAERKPTVPCKYWLNGSCRNGESCTFLHQYSPNGLDNGLTERQQTSQEWYEDLIPEMSIEQVMERAEQVEELLLQISDMTGHIHVLETRLQEKEKENTDLKAEMVNLKKKMEELGAKQK